MALFNPDKAIFSSLKEDIQELLQKFAEKNSLKFADFAACWRDMSFSFVFTFKLNQSELREFIEEALLIVLEFLEEGISLERSISCIYLLYCMYISQPLEQKIPYKLTMEKLRRCRQIYDQCQNCGHTDTCYVWLKLTALGAFYFSLRERPLGPTYLRKTGSLPRNELDIPSDLDFSESINELKRVHEDYLNIKKALGPENLAISELDMVKDTLFKEYTRIWDRRKSSQSKESSDDK